MLTLLKRLLGPTSVEPQPLIEGRWADEYPELEVDGPRIGIRQAYRLRWTPPEPTPASHPWLYDPCIPPQGWRYDPYYELWIKL